MFSSYRKNVLVITTAFMVITSINGSAAFAEDELVTRARQLREVAIQKRENEARQAMTEASRLSKFSLTRAAEYLKPILESIESDEQLPAEKRDSLARILKSQIKVYEKNVGVSNSKNLEAAQSQAQINDRLADIDRLARDNEKFARNIDSIKKSS